MPTLRSLLVLLPLLVLLAGCGEPAPEVGGKPREKTYTRIISMSPAITQLLAARFEITKEVVGVTDRCTHISAKGKPAVVVNTKIDLERLREAQPDFIIYDSSLFGPDEIAKIKESGVESFDFSPNSYAEFKEQALRLSSLLRGETTISEYCDKIEASFSKAEAQLKGRPKAKSVLLMANGGEYMAAGRNTLFADLIAKAGTDYVAFDADKFVTINVEQLLAWNPDIVFILGEAGPFARDPRVRTLKAVQGRQVFALQEDPMLNMIQYDLILETLVPKAVNWADRQATAPPTTP
jgi:ABC-type Fe3+-hydroxamate transport system substrate-binding protein